ncbi:MAG TPA: XRE family transcriptional regulator [Thermoclostridium sp.]
MLTQKILQELQAYLDKNFHPARLFERTSFMVSEPLHYELENFIEGNKKPTFSQTLLKFIDKKGLSDSQVYRRAGIDRRHFSKIRSNSGYKPNKSTVISLALALELDKNETNELLASAGYSLSKSELSDLVILFCIERKIYKTEDVNSALEHFGLKPIGGVIE